MVKKSKKIISALIWLAIVIVIVIVFHALSSPHPGGNPINTECIAQQGFTCQNPTLNADSFTAVLGQSTDSNWENTYFLWVPSGYRLPNNPNTFCPPAGSNSVSEGISCYDAGNISNGGIVPANFTFNSSSASSSTFSGTLWASYYVNSQGPYTIQIATATLKAT